ncbi:MAG TPA: helical backbone metal receptor [Candidatus Elarobacter sp.]
MRSLGVAALLALAIVPAAAGAAPAHRIVSLIPSLTEDLFAVGAGASVVGVSAYSDYPAEAKRRPVVATFTSLATEKIVALHPDAVVAIESQRAQARDLTRAGIRVQFYRDDSLADVYANLRAMGALTGHAAAAETLVTRLRARTAALTASVPHGGHRPSVFVVLGTAPIFTVGNGSYIARLIELAGGRNAASDVPFPYARYSAETLVARQPDLLIVDPSVDLAAVNDRPPWNALGAVRAGRIATLPDPAILERPGPRYNDGLAWLIAVLRRKVSS